MGVELPELTRDGFRQALGTAGESLKAMDGADGATTPPALDRLFAHYQELRRWAPRMSLIGPGTAQEAVARHYAESLAAVRWLRPDASLVDVGSGAGFPGLVLAAAVPGLAVWLVESRLRKAAFLEAATRRMAVTATVIAKRLGPELPAGLPARIDFVALRAVRLEPRTWQRLVAALTPGSRVLWWTANGAPAPELPDSLVEVDGQSLPGQSRRLRVLRPSAGAAE